MRPERASRYHAACVYPDGSLLETIDGRNAYHTGVRLGNAGFSHTPPAGRGFFGSTTRALSAEGGRFDADYAALMLLYGTDGDIVETSAVQQQHIHRMSDDALDVRHAPYYCLSAFTAPLTPNRSTRPAKFLQLCVLRRRRADLRRR